MKKGRQFVFRNGCNREQKNLNSKKEKTKMIVHPVEKRTISHIRKKEEYNNGRKMCKNSTRGNLKISLFW